VLPPVTLSPVTRGDEALLPVKWSDEDTAEVPVGLLTTTSTLPAARDGDPRATARRGPRPGCG